jgi:hypothetical protein
MTSLNTFDASHNALTGSIPELSNLPALTGFHVNDNQLSGAMPSLSSLSSLHSIHVGENRLSGPLPLTPFPDSLTAAASNLCPNRFDVRDDPAWDNATNQYPWWTLCDQLFFDDFDP